MYKTILPLSLTKVLLSTVLGCTLHGGTKHYSIVQYIVINIQYYTLQAGTSLVTSCPKLIVVLTIGESGPLSEGSFSIPPRLTGLLTRGAPSVTVEDLTISG